MVKKKSKFCTKHFLFQHIEKLFLAGILLVFVILTYNAFQHEVFSITPEELQAGTHKATLTVENSHLSPELESDLFGSLSYHSLVQETLSPVDPSLLKIEAKSYVLAYVPKRGQPQILPLKPIRLFPLRGSVEVINTDSNETEHKGFNGIVLTSVFPHQDQLEEFFKIGFYPNSEVVDITEIVLQRADITDLKPGDKLNWLTFDLEDYAKEVATWTKRESMIQFESTNRMTTSPIPNIYGHQWGNEAVYSPLVRSLEDITEAQPAEIPRTYELVRFVDFKATPGRTYKYRIKYFVENPNYLFPKLSRLSDEAIALREQKFIESHWVESEAIPTEKNDLLCYALRADRKSASIYQQQRARVMIARWDEKTGMMLSTPVSLLPGQSVNFIDLTVQGISRETQDWINVNRDMPSNKCLISIMGGDRLPSRSGVTELSPATLLFMDDQGNISVQEQTMDSLKLDALSF